MNGRYLIVRTDIGGDRFPLVNERALIRDRDDVTLRGMDCRTEDDVIAAAQDADVLITNESYITRRVLASLPKLRAVVRYGIGYDRVDLEAATEYGVAVVNIPGFCAQELAFHVLLLILAWNKRLIPFNAGVHAGRWAEMRDSVSDGMGATAGQLLGIWGFGCSGRETARIALAVGMRVAAFSPHLTEADLAMGVQRMDRDEMLAACDFLTIHCALTDKTRGCVNASAFARMKPSAVVINTSRGAVIDEAALIAALRDRTIAGAGLDVLEAEPPANDNPLLSMPNVLITPHVSHYSDGSVRLLEESVMREALRAIAPGEMPKNVVNRAVLERPNCRLHKPL